MFKLRILFLLCLIQTAVYSQQTKVSGRVTDAETGEGIPDVRVQFQYSKIGTLTDSLGFYTLQTYYATDSITYLMPEFTMVTRAVKKDQEQVIDVKLSEAVMDITEVTVKPPDEFPSTTLH